MRNAFIGVLGIWMIIAPFLRMSALANAWNDWIVGVVVAVVGLTTTTGWARAVSGLFGIWLIIAGFVPGLHFGAGLFWNDIIVGLAFVVAGFAGAPQRVQTVP